MVILSYGNQIERESVYRETIRRAFRPTLIQLIGNSQAPPTEGNHKNPSQRNSLEFTIFLERSRGPCYFCHNNFFQIACYFGKMIGMNKVRLLCELQLVNYL